MIKKYPFFFFLFILFASCNLYKQAVLPTEQFFSDKQLPEDVEYYDFYINDGQNTYKLENPSVKNKTIQGKPQLAMASTSPEKIKTKKEAREHKMDVNIYVNKPLSSLIANTEETMVPLPDKISISKDDISDIKIYEKDKKGTVTGWAAGVIIILLILLVLAFIWLINTSDNSSNGGSTWGSSGS